VENQHHERREYYRIDDTVGLSYVVVEEGEAAPTETSGGFGMNLTSVVAEIDREFNQISNTLWHESPAIAQALGLLNKKISIVAAINLQQDVQPVDPHDEVMVNISGTGIAFNCNENLTTGTRLRLAIVLKPSNIHLTFMGDVIACDKQDAIQDVGMYWMRVNIDQDNDAVHEQLIQHVVQKQYANSESRKL
jgi:hypothetical protein